MRIAVCLTLLLALAPHACADDAFDLNDSAAVAAVVRDLASENFPTRQRAQDRLETLSPIHLEQLRQLAAKTQDQEAQARLIARVENLEEILAIDPPSISLSLPAAPFSTVAQELAKATGWNIRSSGVDVRYQLEVKGASFPRIIQILNEQNPMWATASTTGIVLSRLTGVWQQSTTYRGFGVFIRDGALPAPAGRRAPPPADNPLPIANSGYVVGVLADPRIRMVQFTNIEIKSVVDENKNPWTPIMAGSFVVSPLIPRPCVTSQSVQLVPPANPGKSIALLRGQFTAEVALGEDRVEIANSSDKINQPIIVGDTEVTLQTLGIANAGAVARPVIRLQVEARPAPASQSVASTGQGALVTVLDANGKEILSRGIQRGVTTTMGMSTTAPPDVKEPFKVIITAPTRMRTITIPFEFKNLTAPAQ